jgi:2-haloacid dehalogenase
VGKIACALLPTRRCSGRRFCPPYALLQTRNRYARRAFGGPGSALHRFAWRAEDARERACGSRCIASGTRYPEERNTMATPEVLRREIKALAFDQYGTIVDMQKGLTDAVTPFLKRKGWDGKPNSFVTWWRRTHFENSMIDALCDRGHTPYREIGQRAVAYVMDRCGIGYTADEVRSLVSEIEKLKPFPDVAPALAKLRSKGYKLAILSNGDRDMLAAAGPHIGFRFDHVISVEEAGYFKPHWKTYAKAAEIMRQDPSSILFVANHAFDCIGAKSYGMRTAFIDRRKRPFGQTPHQPDLVVGDFAELAAVLA